MTEMVFEYRPLLFGRENGKKATKNEEKGKIKRKIEGKTGT
jgi:hypothetical protein